MATLLKNAPVERDIDRVATRTPLFSWPLVLGIVGVVTLLVISLLSGEYDIFHNTDGWDMLRDSRIPRTIALVLSGAAMAMSGLVMQLLTQNRFVEPTTTGTTEWAGIGLLFVMFFLPGASILGKMVGAVVFAFIGTMVFFLFLRQVSLKSSLIVPIIGIMLGAVVSAISTFFALKTDMMQSLGVWLQGSFTSVYKGQYEVLWIVLGVVVVVFLIADRLTVAGLGQDIATNVGLNYNKMVIVGTGLIAIATGVVTVVVGNLPFLGLIVPNIISMFRGDDLRSNLPWVCLLGIAIVTLCDLCARTLISPFEIPVSVVLGIIGAVVFISLIIQGQRHGK
ncbi:iron chelate uptake ABC transporter family permease subunit [Corynebacterium poyangense]|uniref:Iron chelate uptake ABC transporter family permease subunit n=1 Tax=Corynebacterium poyangense TaxID=2684405 RepID=A0A7H0SMQ6_9CORY|nr:iron chelate uptake ABC transporter family permease subunit [Corynebacterium poyangense]MBZ8176940.1 iron chelate uptake ABC transporter family permease subunit [Corynebacterium poyangense]QNQ89831.1 iron chelate uptake ABC transporter family permease subunit [Corynebacterium poyangense]